MDDTTLLKMIFDGNLELLEESQNIPIKEAEGIDPLNPTQDPIQTSETSKDQEITNPPIPNEFNPLTEEDFIPDPAPTLNIIGLNDGDVIPATANTDPEIHKAVENTFNSILNSLKSKDPAYFDETGGELKDPSLHSIFIYERLSEDVTAQYTKYTSSRANGKSSWFSTYLTMLDKEGGPQSVGYIRAMYTFKRKGELRPIKPYNGYLVAPDAVGDMHLFAPLTDLNISDLAYYSKVRRKLVDYIFSDDSLYKIWFKEIEVIPSAKYKQLQQQQQQPAKKTDIQRTRGLSSFNKEELQQTQNIISNSFKSFTKSLPRLLKGTGLENSQYTLYAGNYILGERPVKESAIQQFNKLKEADTFADPIEAQRAARAAYDKQKRDTLKYAASGYFDFDEPSVIELQINVNFSPKGERKISQVTTKVKDNMADLKNKYDTVKKDITALGQNILKNAPKEKK